MRNRYITTTKNITYENARELERLFVAEYPEQAESGALYGVRFSTLQTNSAIANNFILQTGMIYGAVVLMVICLTVLSLQQLLDAGQYKYRFSVLRKLGVEEHHINKLILKQLSVWFGLPIIVPSVDKGTYGFAPRIFDSATLLSLSVRPVRFVPAPCRIKNLRRKTPSDPG